MPPLKPLTSLSFTSKIASRAMSSSPRFASGTDAAALTPAVTPLLSASGGRWTLAAEGEALERSFKFKTFAKTWVRHTPLSDVLLFCLEELKGVRNGRSDVDVDRIS